VLLILEIDYFTTSPLAVLVTHNGWRDRLPLTVPLYRQSARNTSYLEYAGLDAQCVLMCALPLVVYADTHSYSRTFICRIPHIDPPILVRSINEEAIVRFLDDKPNTRLRKL
jgi:hypothetical protein